MKNTNVSVLLIAAVLAAAAGCSTPDWKKERHDTAVKFQRDIQKETRELLANYPDGLSLTDCVAIARARSTRLIGSKFATKMAQIDRDESFSAFLPQVNAAFDLTALSKPPAKEFQGQSITFSDQRVTEGSVQIMQPVFTPSAWLMYVTAKRGAEIAGLSEERAGQMLDLYVANLFYQHCAADDEIARLDSARAAADEQLKETKALVAKGYSTDAAVARARASALEAANRCASERRAAQLAASRLLQVMDLWPLARVKFKTATLLAAASAHYEISTPGEKTREISADDFEKTPVAEWMYHALLSRPEMHAGDRSIALRKNEIIRSLAMFLPNLTGFANYYTTSDSITVNQQYWADGIQGTLSLFDGFRSVNEYRHAREALKAARVDREETAMMILLQVVEAQKTLVDTRASLEVAAAAEAAAAKTLAETEAQYRGGLVRLSDVQDAQAAEAAAVAQQHDAACARAVALYAFENVLGGNVREIR